MSGLKKIGGFDLNEKRALIEPQNTQFPQRAQCKLLGICRSGLYYEPQEPSEEDLRLMYAIDKQYLETPYYGRRRMTVMKQQGFDVGQKRVRTAM